MDAIIHTASLVLSLGVIIGLLSPKQLNQDEWIGYLFNRYHFSAMQNIIDADTDYRIPGEERIPFYAHDIPIYHVSKDADKGYITQRYFQGCGKYVRVGAYDEDSLEDMEAVLKLQVPLMSKDDKVFRWDRVFKTCGKARMSCDAIARDVSHRRALRMLYNDETERVALVIEDFLSPLLTDFWVANLAGVIAYADSQTPGWSVIRLDVSFQNEFWRNQNKCGLFLTSEVLAQKSLDVIPSAYLIRRSKLLEIDNYGMEAASDDSGLRSVWLNEIQGSNMIVLPPMFATADWPPNTTQNFLDSLLMALLQYDRHSEYLPPNVALMLGPYNVYNTTHVLPDARRASRWQVTHVKTVF